MTVPIRIEERSVVEVLGGIGSYTVCVNDPPWSSVAARVAPPARVIVVKSMELDHLESLVSSEPDSETVVGLGGGSAIDTAKFVAWKTGKRLIQIPSITSVDAGFTDAIGVRTKGRVRYIGRVLPQYVALDIDLVRSAPERMNRSGVGDVLSCHTALWDWRFAVDRSEGVPWDADAASLGRQLLAELDERAEAINAITPDAVRWLASAYQRIGAACSALRHSRFEEGSEHFLAYAYEHRTNGHPLHGELIALCVVAMCTLQDNAPEWARSVVKRTGVTANPADLGVTRDDFVGALRSLHDYVERERLDYSIVNARTIDARTAERLWVAVQTVSRQ